MSDVVLIERDSADASARGTRVFVTGPHFGGDIYSSTTNRDAASRFDRRTAERMLAVGKWRELRPVIVEVE